MNDGNQIIETCIEKEDIESTIANHNRKHHTKALNANVFDVKIHSKL